jgi:hypothetical protein
MLKLTDYLTSDTYKALTIICKRMGISVKDMTPQLKICWARGTNMTFYQINARIIEGNKFDLQLFWIGKDGKYYDNDCIEIDLKEAKINKIDRAFHYNQMEKSKHETVLITFG